MGFPFGSTTFGQYLAWAKAVGCDCQTGYGGMHNSVFWKITAPSGLYVTVVDTQQDERLISSNLNYLDRRLGLQSPFNRIHPDE
jgi:hypothetical protein